MCHVGQTLPLKSMNTIEKPGTCSTSEELLPPQERWFRAQGHWSKEKKKIKKKKTSCKQKKLRKRLGWQGTDPELLHYRLGRKEQENLQASSQVLKASKADGRKHSGSSYNSLTGLPKWHYLPQPWQQAAEYSSPHLSPWPYYEAIPDCFWAVCVCVEENEESLSLGAASPPAWRHPGTAPEQRAAAIWNSWVCFQHFSVEMRGCRAAQRLLRSLASPALC